LPEDGRLTCFEINPDFCRCLQQIADPRLHIINDDARNCERYVENPDCVVSGLPLTLFNKQAMEQILTICRKSGRYIQLQYSPVLSREIRRHFVEVRLRFVPQNFPPAFVYVCKHARNGEK
jgi:phospholipid N-methyltransferase